MQPNDKLTNESVVISEETIVRALEATRARIARQEQQRTELTRLMEAMREEERLLLSLLSVRRGGVGQSEDPDEARAEVETKANSIPAARPLALQAVIEELTTAGRPLHISELMRLLEQRQIAIPGAGTQANLIIHLRRDRRLVRPSRGMYALASSGLEDMSASPRRRRKKRVRVTAKAERVNS